MNLSFFLNTRISLSPEVPDQALLDGVTAIGNAYLVESQGVNAKQPFHPQGLYDAISTFLDNALSPKDRLQVQVFVKYAGEEGLWDVYLEPTN